MAFDVAEIQSQVQLLTGSDQLNSKVLNWINRTVMDICTRTYFPKQMGECMVSTSDTAMDTSVLGNAVVSIGTPGTNFIAPYYAAACTATASTPTVIADVFLHQQAIQGEVMDVLHRAHDTTERRGTVIEHYAMAYGSNDTSSATTGGTQSVYVLPYPHFASPTATNTAGQQFLYLRYLKAPAALTLGNQTLWLTENYFRVVLAGVMRYARLYLGDPRGYLMEKALFENGVAEMMLQEQTGLPASPVLRGVYPEVFTRNQ